VTYAIESDGFQVGAGLGYVDVFDSNGNLLQSEAISQGALKRAWPVVKLGYGCSVTETDPCHLWRSAQQDPLDKLQLFQAIGLE
jgi:hypothetical protein